MLYLVLEYLEGKGLDEVADAPVASRSAEIAIRSSRLKVAHQSRILHRDITLPNVMLTRRPRQSPRFRTEQDPDRGRARLKGTRHTGEGMIVGRSTISPGRRSEARWTSARPSFGIVLPDARGSASVLARASRRWSRMTRDADPRPQPDRVPDVPKQTSRAPARTRPSAGSAGQMTRPPDGAPGFVVRLRAARDARGRRVPRAGVRGRGSLPVPRDVGLEASHLALGLHGAARAPEEDGAAQGREPGAPGSAVPLSGRRSPPRGRRRHAAVGARLLTSRLTRRPIRALRQFTLLGKS